jgi:hypothetical protein
LKYSEFVEDYIFYTAHNETPEIFHTWIGLSTLAAAAEKRLWLDRSYFKVYLNLYILLLAPAGLCAKSTSMGVQERMLKEAELNVLTGDTTKQKIIEDLCDRQDQFNISDTKLFIHSSASYITDELNALLTTGSEMSKFLVEMWGAADSYVYRPKGAGVYEVTNPYFNLMGALVPEWFASNLANDLGSTGFLARCIIVFKREKRGIWADPYIDEEQEKARRRCLERLYKIKQLYGNIEETKDAKAWYKEWYESQRISTGEDYRMSGYLERRNKVHILKVAALMALGDIRKRVEVIDYERALKIFSATDYDMRLAYQLTGANRLAPHMYRVVAILDSNKGKMPVMELARIFTPDLAYFDFQRVCQSLIHSGEAELEKDDKGQLYLTRSKRDGKKS